MINRVSDCLLIVANYQFEAVPRSAGYAVTVRESFPSPLTGNPIQTAPEVVEEVLTLADAIGLIDQIEDDAKITK